MHAGDRWRLGRRPALDGLRGVAILLVLAAHVGIPHMDLAGSTGVGVFFVLSGFLIATLLLEETDRTGRVNVAAFYRRRARRLLPALFTMLAAVVLVGLVVDGFTSRRMVFGSLLYGSNWVRANGLSHPDALGHTWSLAIEEQFYLVAPFVVMALHRRPRMLLVVSSVGAVGDMLVRAVIASGAGFSPDRLHYATYLRLDGLLIGIALAAACHLNVGRQAGWALVLGVFTLTAAWAVPINARAFYAFTPFAVSLAAVPLIRYALTSGGVLGSRWLLWVGRRSYGLYLWHYPVLLLARRADVPWLIAGPVAVLVSVGVAAVSYRWVESPFLRGSVRAADPHVRTPRVVPSWPEPAVVYGRETT